jgi:leader peptidase (prepilin peptidase)/N-methyltransferase
MSLANFFLSPAVALWALIGLGVGLAVSQVADTFTMHRQLANSPRIPRRTVWLAIAAAVLFGLAGWQFGLTPRGALSCVYIAVLLLLAVTDLEHRLIPHAIILPAILIALVAGFFVDWMTWKAALLGGVIGLAFFGIAYGMAGVFYPGKIGLGMGDVTLATFIGLAIGFPSALVAIVLGILMGGLVSVLLLLARRATLQTAIPYGPFLILGGFVAMFWGPAIVKWYLRM